jgi:hypothetical protein
VGAHHLAGDPRLHVLHDHRRPRRRARGGGRSTRSRSASSPPC